jgi:sulfonate transport system ATP-binding protein
MTSIKLSNVTKTYNGKSGVHTVLDHLTIDFSCDACTVILGKSGSGKTTLLRLLADLEEPNEGSIMWPEKTPFGMMFQEARLMPWLTCRENAAFGLKKSPNNKKKIDDLLSLVHLTDAAALYPKELSGGMQQRTALARTLAMDSKVILMDEPFAALDYFTRYHLQQELIQLKHQKQVGIILVTHNIEEAMILGDRILVLDHGQFTYEEQVTAAHKDRDLLSEPFIRLKRRILTALS